MSKIETSRGTGPEMSAKWRNMSPDKFIVLARDGEKPSEHNIYVEGVGYLTDQIDPNQNRASKDHWNKQFLNPEKFQESWKPRKGPLDLVNELRKLEPDKPFRILSLGAGLGDFTVDLAKLGDNIVVTHVDFSKQANKIARLRVKKYEVSDKVKVITATNMAVLDRMTRAEETVDFIFVYGGLPDNTPGLETTETTFKKADHVLKEGGYLWFVGLVQPFLLGKGDQRAIDIGGEYPSHPDVIEGIFRRIPGWHVVKKEVGERYPLDNHPITPGGEAVKHVHIIERMLIMKSEGVLTQPTPEFSFK